MWFSMSYLTYPLKEMFSTQPIFSIELQNWLLLTYFQLSLDFPDLIIKLFKNQVIYSGTWQKSTGAEPDFIGIIINCCAGDPQSKINRETSNLWINDHNALIVKGFFLDQNCGWKGDRHSEFSLLRKKAVIWCLAVMFGCKAGTLSKSSLFSHGPPNTHDCNN